jgi:hypothetical protein
MKKLSIIFLALYTFLSYSSEIEHKLEKHCPFVIGNKTFHKSDLQNLPEHEVEGLIEISKSPCCLSGGALSPYYFDKLRGMRAAIKQGIVVQRCSYDKIVDDTRVERCTKATTCCAVATPFVEGLGWISFGCNISKAVLCGLVCGWACAVAAPCTVCSLYTCCEVCCGKSIREEIILE